MGKSIRSTAKEFGIPYNTLRDHVEVRVRKIFPAGESKMTTLGKKPRGVFTPEQEMSMKVYLKDAADICLGLTGEEAREFAFKCGLYFGVKMPENWHRNEKAGTRWFRGFRKRQQLSYRKPESLSYNRILAWTSDAANTFMYNLGQLLEKHQFHPLRIYAGDETGVTTVGSNPKVIVPTGQKRVCSPAASERGQLVTVMASVSAGGQSIPPMYVFPRKHFKEQMLKNGPTGSIGHATPSGWMDAPGFLKFMKHIQFVTNCTPSEPILFIMDNFYAHLDPAVIDFAKENGIHLLTTPAHCTHKLMPLDISVFKAFKSNFKRDCHAWNKIHTKKIDIYDIPEITRTSWMKAANPENIASGFCKAGIWPFDRHKFDDEFVKSKTTSDHHAAHAPETAHDTSLDTSIPGTSINDSANCVTPTPEPRISPSQNTESDPIPELLQGAKGSTWVDSNLTVDQFLRSHGLTRLRVPGDGHCILYAVSLSLRSCGICLDDENAVASRMVAEINDNLAFYGQFTDSLIPDVLKYINEKSYTSETADLIINILSNAYGVGTTVIRMGQNGNCSLVQQNPRYASPHPRRIFLYRTGEGNATHYDAVTDMGAQLDGKLFADSSVDLILGARADDTRDISADDTADKTCVISIDNTGTSTDNTGIISNDKDVASTNDMDISGLSRASTSDTVTGVADLPPKSRVSHASVNLSLDVPSASACSKSQPEIHVNKQQESRRSRHKSRVIPEQNLVAKTRSLTKALRQNIPQPSPPVSRKRNCKRSHTPSEVLTSTPVKERIAREANREIQKQIATEKRKQDKQEREIALEVSKRLRQKESNSSSAIGPRSRSHAGGRGRGRRGRGTVNPTRVSRKDWFCTLCGMKWSETQEAWTMCHICQNWSHEDCADEDDAGYVCFQCNGE